MLRWAFVRCKSSLSTAVLRAPTVPASVIRRRVLPVGLRGADPPPDPADVRASEPPVPLARRLAPPKQRKKPRKRKLSVLKLSPAQRLQQERRQRILPPARDPHEWLPHEDVLLARLLRERGYPEQKIDWDLLRDEHFPSHSILNLYARASYEQRHNARAGGGAGHHFHQHYHHNSSGGGGGHKAGDARAGEVKGLHEPWSVAEVAALDAVVEKFRRKDGHRWKLVAGALQHRRSPIVYRLKWMETLPQHAARGAAWTPAEDEMLRGRKLGQLGALHLPGRTYKEVYARYQHLRATAAEATSATQRADAPPSSLDTQGITETTTARSINKARKWTPEEHALLLQAVEKYGVKQRAFSWIAKEVGRSCVSCWCRYHRVVLRPTETQVTPEEKYKLLRAIEKHGRKFSLIARLYFAGRSPERLRGLANGLYGTNRRTLAEAIAVVKAQAAAAADP